MRESSSNSICPHVMSHTERNDLLKSVDKNKPTLQKNENGEMVKTSRFQI